MRYQSLSSFKKHLISAAPEHFSRLYLILSPDDFERKKAIQMLLHSLGSSEEPVQWLLADEVAVSDIYHVLFSPSLFQIDPRIVIDHVEKMEKKELSALIKVPLSGYLILAGKTKLAAFAEIEKMGVILDLLEEKPWDKEKRITQEMQETVQNAGKRIASDAFSLLIDKVGLDPALLEQEVNKLLLYTADRPMIDRADVVSLTGQSKIETNWKLAEEMIWEGKMAVFESLNVALPVLRGQLQLGLKICSLLTSGMPVDPKSPYLSKIWPKTLEKRKAQAERLGEEYFQKGLDILFEIELLSRGGSKEEASLLQVLNTQLQLHHVQR